MDKSRVSAEVSKLARCAREYNIEANAENRRSVHGNAGTNWSPKWTKSEKMGFSHEKHAPFYLSSGCGKKFIFFINENFGQFLSKQAVYLGIKFKTKSTFI